MLVRKIIEGKPIHDVFTVRADQPIMEVAKVLANDVRAERGFRELIDFVLGPTGVPYDWEYGSEG